MKIKLPKQLVSMVLSVLALAASSALAEKKYGPGYLRSYLGLWMLSFTVLLTDALS